MIVIYCGQHLEYKPKEKPKHNCNTCELLFVLVCRDNKYISGALDPDAFFSQLNKEDLEKACSGLETSVVGSL